MKKISIYELNLSTFNNKKGLNKYLSIIEKIEYLKSLNIDILAIDDILLKCYEINGNYEFNDWSNLQDFKKLVELCSANNIKIMPTINIAKLKKSIIAKKHLISIYRNKSAENESNKNDIESYLLTQEFLVPTIENISNLSVFLKEIISFYSVLGIKGFILEDFEFLINKKTNNIKSKFSFLLDIYRIIKHINFGSMVIWKTKQYNDFLNIIDIANQNDLIFFDYIYLTHLSDINLKNSWDWIKFNKLNVKKLFELWKPFCNNEQYILSLSSNYSGWVVNKYGDNLSFYKESAKSLLMFLMLSKNSYSLYNGDELGILGTDSNNIFNFNNINFNEEKKFYQSRNISSQKYIESQIKFNPITLQIEFPWTNNIQNLDFIQPKLRNKINVEQQLTSKDSTFNFYSNLVRILNKSKYSIYFKGFNKVLLCNNLISIEYSTSENKKLLILLNLNSFPIKSYIWNQYLILSSSYTNKYYSNIPEYLSPYECLILIKDNN